MEYIRGLLSYVVKTGYSYGSVKGAKASAMIYSLASTANANVLKPEEYFPNLLSSTKPIIPC